MKLLNTIFSWAIKKRLHQVELFKKYPVEVQYEWFQTLIQTAKHTEWGEKYRYGLIKSVNDFKERVPVQEYEAIKPQILRQKQGAKNILWPGEVKWFAKSSGTTSDKSKFIPVTKEALEECHYKGGKDMLAMYYNNRPASKLFAGKTLVVGGSSQVNHFSSHSYYGDLSAILMKNFPFWVEARRTPNLSIALMDEWEEKLDKMAHATAIENVTNISGVPSWTLVLLRRVLEISGKSNIHDVWPNLELYMHGGVNFSPYRTQYQKISNPKLNFLETYNASEGFFGIQDELNNDAMLLMLDYGIFYEFMPIEEVGKDFPATLLLNEVEIGKHYALVISTNAGLWRYMVGDTIQFTSLSPYRIKVTGRTKQFINAFGEEVIIDNVEKALARACKKTDSSVKEFTVAPVYMEDRLSGSHEWLIEFDSQPQNLMHFTEVLDCSLQELNSDYQAKRFNNLALHAPSIQPLEEGTFYGWMKKRKRLGGQNKVPRLSNHRQYVEDIQVYVNERKEKLRA